MATANPKFWRSGRARRPNQQTLAAFSCRTGRQLWAQTIRAQYESPLINPPPNWPVIVDLDGDGRSEIVVADSGPMARGMTTGACGCSTVPRARSDGFGRCIPRAPVLAPWRCSTMDWLRSSPPRISTATARATWLPSRGSTAGNRSHCCERQYLRRRDLRQGWPFALVVALGLQGGLLCVRPLIWPPFLWGRGRDGWPMLAVPLGGTEGDADRPGALPTLIMSRRGSISSPLADGRELHAIDGLSWPRPADLDGDGLEDLWGSVDGKLRAYRGEAPEAWRVLGRYHEGG